MLIVNHNKGRLGNSIFRLLANIVFLIVYDIDGEIKYNYIKHNIEINDEYFVNWSNEILNGKIPDIKKTSVLYFTGFYQHDKIFIHFKNQIIDYINNHDNLLLLTDRNDTYNASYLIKYELQKKYDIIVHLRLEDFVEINQVLNPLSICRILDEIDVTKNYNDICFVVNKPKKETEFKYIDFFKKRYNTVIESNEPIEDYNIMKNAEILICSYSTLSWCAAFFSDSNKYVYIPNYKTSLHQSFKTINNTILYDCEFCSIEKLNSILSET